MWDHPRDLIAITFDVDWAPEEVIQYTVDLLDKYQVKATFFATGESNCLKSVDTTRYEVGLHPNFNQGGDHNEIITKLKAVYTDAWGVSSHSLFQSSRILQLFVDNGLKYEMNTYTPLIEGLHPFMRLKGIVSIPFYWADSGHFLFEESFELSRLKLDKKGLKIYSFHPIHVFMNTESMGHYDTYKSFYHEPDILKKYRNTGPGTQTLLVQLLQYLNDNKLPTYLGREICSQYLEESRIS